MKAKKINKFIHKWLSIPLGLIISILCLTGAALVFQQELLEYSNPSHYFVGEIKDKPLPLDELVAATNAQLKDNAVASVKVTNNPARTYTMALTEGFRVSVFVNPYTGKITGRYAVKESDFFTVMAIHRWFLDDSRTWGKALTGWSTVFFIVILITGFCYMSKKIKANYTISFNKGSRKLMFGLHNTLGVYAAVVLIVCSLSGLMWSFETFRNTVFTLAGAEEQAVQRGGGEGNRAKKEQPIVNTTHWQAALENSLFGSNAYDYVRISDKLVSAHPANTYRGRVQDQLTFDVETGKITKIVPFAQQDTRSRVWAWAYSLHVGDYWGIWSKLFTFIFCIVGASLPFTGYYFTIKKWIEKRAKKKKALASSK